MEGKRSGERIYRNLDTLTSHVTACPLRFCVSILPVPLRNVFSPSTHPGGDS